MKRPFLLIAGESKYTLQLAFARDEWTWTSMPSKFWEGSTAGIVGTEGLLCFGTFNDIKVRDAIFQHVEETKLPCWPPIETLKLLATDRHKLRADCNKFLWGEDLATYYSPEIIRFVFSEDANGANLAWLNIPEWDRDKVVKIGHMHQGNDKFLCQNKEELAEALAKAQYYYHDENNGYSYQGLDHEYAEYVSGIWTSGATVENYFPGRSIRILRIQNRVWCIETINEESWIKNGPGAEMVVLESFEGLGTSHDITEAIRLAKRMHKYYGLEISGVDFQVTEAGVWHFLEINLFPGFDVCDKTVEAAKKLFTEKMDWLESQACLKELGADYSER